MVWGDGARLSFRRSLGTSVISEVVIGMGASIGREAAPKLMGSISLPIVLPALACSGIALVGAAAMLGAAMQAPLAGLALIMELTHGGFAIMIPLVLATVIATVVARHIDGYSIYSARLRAHPLR